VTLSNPGFSAEDRALLRDAVARFVARHGNRPWRRNAPDAPALWREIADLGLAGLLVDAGEGGTGGSDEELALVMELFGHGLIAEPFLGTALLGASLMGALADAGQRARWLPALAAGELRTALAHFEAASGHTRDPAGTSARADGDDIVLHGDKTAVFDAPVAGLLLVSAREAGGRSLFAVPADAAGLTPRPWAAVDGRIAADLVLDGVRLPGQSRLGPPGGAAQAIDHALDRATLAVCSDALGSMQALLAQTREHLCTRRQFGQPLARLQVLQHRLVDMHIAVEESRALLAAARASLAAASPAGAEGDALERQAAVSAAKYKLGQGARFVGEQAVQLHGAMGMTDELAVSHHFKRLLVAESMFGGADFQLARFRAAGGGVPG
jgi:alkylation response protein AidB-like acyl-CoA dehydrogenase